MISKKLLDSDPNIRKLAEEHAYGAPVHQEKPTHKPEHIRNVTLNVFEKDNPSIEYNFEDSNRKEFIDLRIGRGFTHQFNRMCEEIDFNYRTQHHITGVRYKKYKCESMRWQVMIVSQYNNIQAIYVLYTNNSLCMLQNKDWTTELRKPRTTRTGRQFWKYKMGNWQ